MDKSKEKKKRIFFYKDDTYKANEEKNCFSIHFELKIHSDMKCPWDADFIDAKSIVDVDTHFKYKRISSALQQNKLHVVFE